MGVQRLAVDAPRIRVVEIVSDKGISDMFHMYAYLMGTAGLEMQRDQANVI